MEKRELTCIGCPMGCLVTVELDNGEIKRLSGYTCPRGESYARKEVTDPTRIVTSTAKVTGGKKDRVPCKTARDIPKNKIMDIMTEINKINVKAPVHIGDILIENVAKTGVSIIASGHVEQA